MHSLMNVKIINISIIVLSIFLLIYATLTVMYDIQYFMRNSNPLLPSYFSIYMNGYLINLSCFILGGLVPSTYLLIKKKYLLSILIMLIFIVSGFLLRSYLVIYELFYFLTE